MIPSFPFKKIDLFRNLFEKLFDGKLYVLHYVSIIPDTDRHHSALVTSHIQHDILVIERSDRFAFESDTVIAPTT